VSDQDLQLEAAWRDRMNRAGQPLRQLAKSRLHPLAAHATDEFQAALQLLLHVRAARHHQAQTPFLAQRFLELPVQETTVPKKRAALR
jgi:hypothetical protein